MRAKSLQEERVLTFDMYKAITELEEKLKMLEGFLGIELVKSEMKYQKMESPWDSEPPKGKKHE